MSDRRRFCYLSLLVSTSNNMLRPFSEAASDGGEGQPNLGHHHCPCRTRAWRGPTSPRQPGALPRKVVLSACPELAVELAVDG